MLIADTPQLMTVDEFWDFAHRPENHHKRLELVQGEIIEMASSSNLNTVIAGLVIMALGGYVLPRRLGYVTVPDGGFRLNTKTMLQPDAAFIHKDRADLTAKEFQGAPDLAVEVISDNESLVAVKRKVRLYLTHGSFMVWAIYPEDRTVDIYRLNEAGELIARTVELEGELDGGELLPDFRLPVRTLFPD